MSDQKKTRFKKLAKWIFIKVPIIVAIFMLVMIVALKLVERHPDPLRDGFEEYLSKSSGTNATIGELEDIKFFPNVVVNLNDLTMHNANNAAVIDLSVKTAEVSAPFWSMLFGGSRINILDITKLEAVAGQLSPLEIKVENIQIEDRNGPDQYGSFIISNGTYGGKKMSFEAEIESKNKGYKIPKMIPFSLSVGKSSLNATLDKRLTTVALINAVFTHDKKSSEAQEYILVESGEYKKDNPLSCMFDNADSNICNSYIEKKDP